MSQLAFYSLLQGNDKSKRIQAAVGLIEHIEPNVESEDLDYALKRMALVRATLLLYARQAFILSWLNSQLLNRVPESVRVARMLELLDEYTLVTAGLKGREERDLVFGKLFGMHAIVQSNILARATLPDLEKLVKDLIKLSSLKAYLKESCFGVLISLLSKQTPFNTELQSLIVTSTLSSGIDTPESLWLALSCNKLSIDITDATLEKRWKSKQIVSLENVAVLAEILKETTFCHPHVHAVWDAVLECVFELKQLSVHDFWHNLVEEPLLSSTHERKFLAFQLFLRTLPLLTQATLSVVFSPAFMRTFTNNLSSSKNYLHRAAQQIAARMSELAKENKEIGFQIIMQLSGVNGVQQFDKVTKSKTVESIAANLDIEGVKAYIAHLITSFNDKSDETTELRTQTWAMGQLYTLIRNGNVPKSQEIVNEMLAFFTSLAFTTDSPHATDALTKLSGMLQDLLALPIQPLKTPGMVCGASWASVVLSHTAFIAHCENDEELKASFAVSTEILKTLSSVKLADTAKDLATKISTYESLVSHATFMASIDAEICPVISDLSDCATRLFPSSKSTKRKSEPNSEDALNPHDVLLDVLINFMSKPSALLRGVSETVFKVFCGGISEHGVSLIFEVLEGKDDDEEMSEEEDEEEKYGSNEEQESEEESGDDVAEESESEEDEDAIAKLKALITKSMPDLLPASNSASDSDEESFLGDDDMQAFDDKLCEIFKQRKEISNARKTSKDLVMHFKTRLLDLVDIYIRKQGSNPLLLRMVVPLLRLSLKSSGEFQLHEKLNAILKNRLAKVKETSGVSLEFGLEVLKEIHGIASRSSEQAYLKMCSGLCKLVTRSILAEPMPEVVAPPKKKGKAKTGAVAVVVEATREDQIVALYATAIEQKMTKKQCQLTESFFSDFIRAFPVIGWRICASLASFMKIELACNGYQLIEGAKIILAMTQALSKKEGADRKDEVEAVLESMKQSLASVFGRAEEDKDTKGMGAARVKELVKILGAIERKARSVGVVIDFKELKM